MSILELIFLWIVLYIGFSSFFKLCKSLYEWKKLAPQEKAERKREKELKRKRREKYKQILSRADYIFPFPWQSSDRKKYIRKHWQEEDL